jgi:hypothetical protein
MAIRSRKNQYLGINAHLHSILQTAGTEGSPSAWPVFHGQYIIHLMESLNRQLPTGYIAVNEQSLQILGAENGGVPVKRVPDITIYGEETGRTGRQRETAAVPTWEIITDITGSDESLVDAVVIYQQQGGHGLWGKAVTRIELLSPSNKRGGSNFPHYRIKRLETLKEGVPLIEIDYLHESISPIPQSPSYPTQPDSHPYYIAVTDPRHDPSQVITRAYGFDVDHALPTITIPLAGSDEIPFDFGEPYQRAYELGPWYAVVDYEQEPVRFDTYREDDQQRIRARMQAVMRAHQQGKDLEQGPFPIED